MSNEARSPELRKLREQLGRLQPPAGSKEAALQSLESRLHRRRVRRRWLLLAFFPASVFAAAGAYKYVKPGGEPRSDVARPATARPSPRSTTAPAAEPRAVDPARKQSLTTAPQPQPQPQPATNLRPPAGVVQPASKKRGAVLRHRRKKPTERGASGREPQQPGRRAGGIDESELTRQVAAYKEAQKAQRADPAAGLKLWRAMAGRWKDGPFRHEVDLRIIDLLNRLGRYAEARSEARAFVKRHPGSARKSEIRALLDKPLPDPRRKPRRSGSHEREP